MKYMINIALAAVALIAVGVSQAKLTTAAVLDAQQVLQTSKYALSLSKKLEKEYSPRRKELLKEQSELQKQARELHKMKPVKSEKEYKAAEEKYLAKRKKYDEKAQAFANEYRQADEAASKDFTKLVQSSLKDFAKKNGYQMIYHKQALIYFDENKLEDITDKFIKTLPDK